MVTKLVSPIDVLNRPEGIEVMGKTKEGNVFNGKVVKIVQYECELPKFVLVEGTIYDGITILPFSQTTTPNMLKIFDESIFNSAIGLIRRYAVLKESAEYFKDECEKLLS